MASRITNLHQAFHRLAATRTVEDPWGNGIRFHVKRAGAAWQTRRNELRIESPFFRKIAERQGQRLAGEKVEPFHLTDEELRGVDAEVSAKKLAEAIADLLLTGWEGLLGDDGQAVQFSRDEALAFLLSDDYGIPKGLPVPPDQLPEIERRLATIEAQLAAKAEVSAEDRKFADGFYRDDDQVLQERVRYGGWTMGAAMRNFLVVEAEKLEGFYQQSVAGLRKN